MGGVQVSHSMQQHDVHFETSGLWVKHVAKRIKSLGVMFKTQYVSAFSYYPFFGVSIGRDARAGIMGPVATDLWRHTCSGDVFYFYP